MKRLTRKEIQEGLKAVPIERILIGRAESPQTRLTPKQIRFAEEIAKGATKAEAYRKSRETKAKPHTASRQGQKLMKSDAIVAQVEAFKLAMEAERLRTPAQLRALTIQKLTEGALSEDFPPAQRVKCLELLGKITEVALFTERREVVKTSDTAQIRDKLIESIRLAMKSSGATDIDYKSGDELLAEIHGAVVKESSGGEPHPSAAPQEIFDAQDDTKHTNPHIESASEVAHLPSGFEGTDEDRTVDVECGVETTPVSGDTGVKSL